MERHDDYARKQEEAAAEEARTSAVTRAATRRAGDPDRFDGRSGEAFRAVEEAGGGEAEGFEEAEALLELGRRIRTSRPRSSIGADRRDRGRLPGQRRRVRRGGRRGGIRIRAPRPRRLWRPSRTHTLGSGLMARRSLFGGLSTMAVRIRPPQSGWFCPLHHANMCSHGVGRRTGNPGGRRCLVDVLRTRCAGSSCDPPAGTSPQLSGYIERYGISTSHFDPNRGRERRSGPQPGDAAAGGDPRRGFDLQPRAPQGTSLCGGSEGTSLRGVRTGRGVARCAHVADPRPRQRGRG